MPITRKQFELEIDQRIEEWMKKIHSFLTEHKDQAFTEEELEQYCGVSGKSYDQLSVTRNEFASALRKLVELKVAEKRIVQEKDYYSYGTRPLEL